MLWLAVVGSSLACGSNRHAGTPAGERAAHPASKTEETVKSLPELEIHRGVLARTVEEGGWLLKTTGGDYLLLSISSYRQEPWWQVGEGVEVEGRPAPGAITIYMQGVPFRVSAMRPLGQDWQRHR